MKQTLLPSSMQRDEKNKDPKRSVTRRKSDTNPVAMPGRDDTDQTPEKRNSRKTTTSTCTPPSFLPPHSVSTSLSGAFVLRNALQSSTSWLSAGKMQPPSPWRIGPVPIHPPVHDKASRRERDAGERDINLEFLSALQLALCSWARPRTVHFSVRTPFSAQYFCCFLAHYTHFLELHTVHRFFFIHITACDMYRYTRVYVCTNLRGFIGRQLNLRTKACR